MRHVCIRLCQLSAAKSLCSGIDGKISVGLQPLGSGRYSHADLLEQLGQDDRSNKISHCFSVLVDEPASYKMLAQSKTFGKWKASYATWTRRCVLSDFLACVQQASRPLRSHIFWEKPSPWASRWTSQQLRQHPKMPRRPSRTAMRGSEEPKLCEGMALAGIAEAT